MALPMRYEIILFCLILFCLTPVAAGADTMTADGSGQQYRDSVFLFRPASDSIPSTQVNAIINGLHGEVLVATPLGLSTYDGSWSTRHISRNNLSNGIMDNFVTALAYDSSGNLWIGYAGGIQIYNGRDYLIVTDQQLLKSLQIRALQRWNDDMWIATGNSGLNRYHDGDWTWFAPDSPGGPGFYEADSLALDTATDTLLVGTSHEGLWAATESNGTVLFTEIQDRGDPYGLLGQVRRDPLGGAYFFNSTEVAHYNAATGFSTVLSDSGFYGGPYTINDVAAGTNGALYVATENGIYVWQNGAITRHLGTFEGFGTNSHNIRMVFADSGGRIWFSTQDIFGYYTGDVSPAPLIPVVTMTPAPEQIPVPANVSPLITQVSGAPSENPSILDRIAGFFTGFLHPPG
jgi:ligand-binding sensor domain-containing protein